MTDKVQKNSICPVCGEEFECGAKSGKETCWCFELANVLPVNSQQNCLCPNCLKKKIESQKNSNKFALITEVTQMVMLSEARLSL